VQNYTLGTALTNCNFVSFTYTSNVVGSFTITPSTLVSLSGTLPSPLPATATVYVLGPGSNELYTNVSGSWGVGPSDYGATGLWGVYSTATVPTLSTAALGALVLLLAGAGALLARSRRTARV
jgi:hypothetical protein